MNRLITDNQKNAFTLIAKSLREQGVPIRTKKQLQQYVGTETYDDALHVKVDEYNNNILIKREEAKKAKKEEAKKAKKEKEEIITFIPKGDMVEVEFFNLLKTLVDKSVNINLISDGLTETYNFEIPNRDKFNHWWKSTGVWILRINSELVKWDNVEYPNLKVYIYEGKPIEVKKIIQYFKDGSVNCVLLPILNWANTLYDGAKSKQTKSRYNKIKEEIEKFKLSIGTKGVDINILQEISEKLQIDISIEKPITCDDEPYLCDVKTSKKALKHFIYRNVRIDHVEINEFLYMNNIEYVERVELLKIKKKLDKNKTYYTFSKDLTNYSKISTITQTWALNNEFNELINEFEKEQGLDKCYIDDIDDKNLSEFVRSSCHYNSTIDFVDINTIDINNVNHQDMETAYIQHMKCKFYEGFLGKITDFRACDKIEEVGLYQIKNLVFFDKKFEILNKKLNSYKEDIYPSPELKYLSQYCSFTIVAGCWGVKTLDVDMSHDFLKKKYDGIKGYARYVGKCDSHYLRRKLWCNGDETLASIIRETSKGKVESYFNNEICLSYPKTHNYHLSHFTSFITSYQRIQIITQLFSMNPSNLVRVCVDGIYYINEETFNYPFNKKEAKTFENGAGEAYISCYNGIFEIAPKRVHNKKEIHIGAGGNGKTHFNLLDKGLMKVLYVAPSYKLASKKRDEYKCNSNVWANVLSIDPEKINLIQKYNNTLLIDECSMMNEQQKQYIIDTYSNMKIIFCGDLGYQAKPFDILNSLNIEMNTDGLTIIEYSTNYRFTCVNMIKLMKEVRLMIKQNRSDYDVNNYVCRQFKSINDNDVKNLYKIEDMILSLSHIIKNKYTEMFKEMKKWYITKNSRQYHNGDIVIGEQPNTTCELRHCFTIHSIQGETAHHKLFINMDHVYDKRLLYTALSRAKEKSQIYIVKN